MEMKNIKPNGKNPRFIKDDKFLKLKASIEKHPKFMELRPIVVDADGTILGGNMRYRALKDLNFKEIPDNWVKKAEDLTEDEKKAFIIKDNIGFGEWDYGQLAEEWEIDDLEEWGLDMPDDFGIEEEEPSEPKDLSESQENTFEIIIECISESEQEMYFNKLNQEGYKCRVLTL